MAKGDTPVLSVGVGALKATSAHELYCPLTVPGSWKLSGLAMIEDMLVAG
jgi:hypothetical protein